MHIGKTITGNLLTGSLGRIISALTPLILIPLLIRTWGLHQYGEWLILTAIPTYIMLSPDLGLATAVVNQMAIAAASGNKEEAIRLYRTSWLILTVLSFCFAIAGMGAGMLINWRPLGVTELSGKAAVIISTSCFQILLGQQGLLISGIYRCAGRNPRFGLVGSIGGILYFVAAIATLALRGSPLQFVAVGTVARAIFVFIMLFDARRIMPDFTIGFQGVSFETIRPYVIPGLGYATLPLVYALQNEGTVLVVGSILGPSSVAVFQTTRTAVNGAKSLMGLMAAAVAIEIPSLVGAGRMDSLRRLLIVNTQLALLASFGWLCVMGLFGDAIFHLWLRNRVVFSESLTVIMLLSMIPAAVANSCLILLQGTNKIHNAVIWLIPGAAVSLAVTALGSLWFGLNGAACGLFAFEAMSLAVVWFVSSNQTEFSVKESLLAAMSTKSLRTSLRSALGLIRTTAASLQ